MAAWFCFWQNILHTLQGRLRQGLYWKVNILKTEIRRYILRGWWAVVKFNVYSADKCWYMWVNADLYVQHANIYFLKYIFEKYIHGWLCCCQSTIHPQENVSNACFQYSPEIYFQTYVLRWYTCIISCISRNTSNGGCVRARRSIILPGGRWGRGYSLRTLYTRQEGGIHIGGYI